MIERKFFDDLCEDYKHDFDNVQYWFALTDKDGWTATAGDSPCYHEEAHGMYVIRISDLDAETWHHLQTDPSRCIITPSTKKPDDDCPVPIKRECGVYYGDVKYSYERHVHCAKLIYTDILKEGFNKEIEEGFEFEIDGEIAAIRFDEDSQAQLDKTISMLRKGFLKSAPLVVRKNGKEEIVTINKDMVDGLELTAMLHFSHLQSRLYDIQIPALYELTSVEEIEKVEWQRSPLKMRGCADVEQVKAFATRNGLIEGGL